jgi:flagellar biogenesis protein FliO
VASPDVLNVGGPGWADYLRVMLILGALLIFAFLTLRFWMPRLVQLRKSSNGPIRVAARLALEPNKSLYVVTIGKANLLIAGSEAGLHFVTKLEPSDLDGFPLDPIQEEPSNFARLIRAMKSRKDT